MKALNEKQLDELAISMVSYFEENTPYSTLQDILENVSDGLDQKNTILDALIHSLEHYEDDKDIHLNDTSYEVQQKNDIYRLLKCLQNDDSSKCQELINFLEVKEVSFSLKKYFQKLMKKMY